MVSANCQWQSMPLCVTWCRIDASGVPGEWVEPASATEGQPTIVYFLGTRSGSEPLAQSRPFAGELAVLTGARVLTVACSSSERSPSRSGAAQRGVTAYRWLLGEGCTTESTAFAHDASGGSLLEEILLVARKAGLPLPGGTTWSGSDGIWRLRSAITWV